MLRRCMAYVDRKKSPRSGLCGFSCKSPFFDVFKIFLAFQSTEGTLVSQCGSAVLHFLSRGIQLTFSTAWPQPLDPPLSSTRPPSRSGRRRARSEILPPPPNQSIHPPTVPPLAIPSSSLLPLLLFPLRHYAEGFICPRSPEPPRLPSSLSLVRGRRTWRLLFCHRRSRRATSPRLAPGKDLPPFSFFRLALSGQPCPRLPCVVTPIGRSSTLFLLCRRDS